MVSLFIPIAAVGVNLLFQVASYRRWRGTRYFASVITGFLAGLVAFFAMEGVWIGQQEGSDPIYLAVLVDAPIYAALAYCYYSFVQLGQTSVRIRLYSEIAERADGLGVEEVARQYADDALVQVRLQRLVESGDVLKRGEHYFVGRSRLVRISKIMFMAKTVLLGRASEFEKEQR